MELKFDTMEANTHLAEDFLTVHKAQLEKIKSSETEQMDLEEFTDMHSETQNFDDTGLQLESFASKLQENAELIGQLEVLMRGKVKEDVLNYDLKLIVANFKYWSTKGNSRKILGLKSHIHTFQERNYPLSFLGYLAKNIMAASKIVIECNNQTLPMTYLFAIIFHQVGLKSIEFRYIDKVTEEQEYFNDWKGCTAVVGEHADVDSAVDAVLASTSHDPWRIHRIYVQESIYETVKSALSWKCRPKKSSEASGDKSNEVDYLQYGPKKIIFDYPELLTDTTEGHTITKFTQSSHLANEGTQTLFVEAYRTVKELLSLLQKDNSFCLSLWSSDVSEANEIAFNVKTPLVWVNDFGSLDGPAHLSQVFYTNFNPYKYLKCNDKVGKLRDDWSKLSTDNRVEKITCALQKLESESEYHKLKEIAQKLKEMLREMPGNKSLENTKGKMWINMEMPNGVVQIDEALLSNIGYFEALKSAARGNVLLYYDGPRDDSNRTLLSYLCDHNLPFIFRYAYPRTSDKSVLEKVYIHHSRNRIIIINYGSIFAN